MVKKYNTELCDEKMTFDECELAILRNAVDETTKIQGKQSVNNDDIKKMITILENFLIRKKCICYGGTAINNILPKSDQFYNREAEIPDYDFYSKTALEDAKELSDIYFNEGFTDVEAKSGVHKGTYKVFVNFIPIADITFMNSEIYDNLEKESIKILGIHYCPPNYLRMSMYLELSRPAGDVSRWEKVLKRLTLLNKHYPLKPEINCKKVKISNEEDKIKEDIFTNIRDSCIEQGAVFFGGYATYLYSRYMPKDIQKLTNKVPQFDVISENADKCALIVKERLVESGIKSVKIVEYDNIDDIIPKHFEIKIYKKSYAYIYKPIACHNYNVIEINKNKINIATIDTMMSFYLAFIYTNNKYYNKDRILCLAKYLFEVEQHNRLEQTGILKRFTTTCYGKQEGLTSIRAEKAVMHKKLAKKKDTKEYEEWFLKYVPEHLTKNEQTNIKKKVGKYVEIDKKIIKKNLENDEEGGQEDEEQEEQEEKNEGEKEEEKDEETVYMKRKGKNEWEKRQKTKKYTQYQDIRKYGDSKSRYSNRRYRKKTNKKTFFGNFFNRKTRKGFLF